MDLKIIFLLHLIPWVISMNFTNFIFDYQPITVTATAVNQVIDEFYIKNQILFSVLILRNKINHYEILSNVLMQGSGKFLFHLSSFGKVMPENIFLSQSAVIFLQTCDDLVTLHKEAYLVNKFPKPLKFFVYIENCGLEKLRININYYVEHNRLSFGYGTFEAHEFLLIDEGNFIYLTSLEWYTDLECKKLQLVTLNTFDKKLGKWIENLENYQKFKVNFQDFSSYCIGCLDYFRLLSL
jgi:hypothetical protein